MGACVSERESEEKREAATEEVTNRILTLPNVITTIRLIMAPIALWQLVEGNDILATVLFAITAATDFLDGQIARRTHSVSRLGQLLDPIVDRVLMICGVVGLLVVGRLPFWIVIVVLVRDIFLLIGGTYLMKSHKIRVAVIYAGKFATTFLFIGCAGLMLNMPLIPGLGWVDVSWLPGFNGEWCSWGIWSIYIGLCLAVYTTIYYVVQGYKELRKATVGDNA